MSCLLCHGQESQHKYRTLLQVENSEDMSRSGCQSSLWTSCVSPTSTLDAKRKDKNDAKKKDTHETPKKDYKEVLPRWLYAPRVSVCAESNEEALRWGWTSAPAMPALAVAVFFDSVQGHHELRACRVHRDLRWPLWSVAIVVMDYVRTFVCPAVVCTIRLLSILRDPLCAVDWKPW